MKTYLDLLRHVYENGNDRGDRTGTGTRSIFGYQYRHDLINGFPLLTTKRVHFKSVLVELLWFLRGGTTVDFLHEHNVTIWDEWTDENGNLGPVYGKQWRDWNGIDQIDHLLHGLKNHPDCRRHILSAWNVEKLPARMLTPQQNAKEGLMALAPCHVLYQFYVHKNKLSCHMYQRSADLFLGVPFNLASMSLLTHLIAHRLGYEPGEVIHSFGDVHIYSNHFKQVEEQLTRVPRALPKLKIWSLHDRLEDIEPEDVTISGYKPYPSIRAEISI